MFSQEQLPEVPKNEKEQDFETRMMTIGLLNGFIISIVFYYFLKRG